MSVEIAKSLYRKLATEGVTLSSEDFRSIKAAYYRIALDSTEQYFYDAKINGLEYDRHQEEGSVEMFAQSVMSAGEIFLGEPDGVALHPQLESGARRLSGYLRETAACGRRRRLTFTKHRAEKTLSAAPFSRYALMPTWPSASYGANFFVIPLTQIGND